MKGIWKMLTGQGEKEYRKQHRDFDNAIPDAPGFDPATHPAATSNSSDAMNYRRANSMYGLKSKQEHLRFASIQAARAEYEKQIKHVNVADRMPFEDWLRAIGG